MIQNIHMFMIILKANLKINQFLEMDSKIEIITKRQTIIITQIEMYHQMLSNITTTIPMMIPSIHILMTQLIVSMINIKIYRKTNGRRRNSDQLKQN